MNESEDFATDDYSVKVGERIRNIRRQRAMSLQDVEKASGKEFKASVLGAYERGERSISVPRLAKLAEFFGVSTDQLLPHEDAVDIARSAGGGESVVIDLKAIRTTDAPEARVLERYASRIQLERQDFNGRVLTIRRDDLQALGCLFDMTTDAFAQRIAEMGLTANLSASR